MQKIGSPAFIFWSGAPLNFHILSLSNMTFRFLAKSGKFWFFIYFSQIVLKIQTKWKETQFPPSNVKHTCEPLIHYEFALISLIKHEFKLNNQLIALD